MAVSDELGLYAHPRPAIQVDGRTSLVEAIAREVESAHVDEVVVGLPLTLAGDDSPQTAEVRALIVRLRQRLGIPVTEWDERLSSVQASRGAPRATRRTGAVDSASAALVLQAVLDFRRAGPPTR
ncbi:MAG: Holliday junction resolvase RuvX [Tepidiformaceae bacterium]